MVVVVVVVFTGSGGGGGDVHWKWWWWWCSLEVVVVVVVVFTESGGGWKVRHETNFRGREQTSSWSGCGGVEWGAHSENFRRSQMRKVPSSAPETMR